MISLDEYNRSCNFLSPKICVQKETNDINIKVFNMTTNKHNSTSCNSNQKWNKKTCQC